MDRRTLLGALGLALAAPLGSALAAEPPKYTRPGRVYNQNGAYEGRMDSSGRMYDQSGRYVGREDSSGRRYDASGRYQGRTDDDGTLVPCERLAAAQGTINYELLCQISKRIPRICHRGAETSQILQYIV